MSFTSDEVNFLIYRYLQESGFSHTAFALSNECLLHKGTLANTNIPSGALITLLQKALQYVEVEWKLDEEGEEVACDQQPTLFSAFKVPEDRKKIKREKKEEKEEKIKEKETTEKGKRKKAKVEAEVVQSNGVYEPVEIQNSAVTTLIGHESDVFMCSWNPKKSVIASGSEDTTARIWEIPPGNCGSHVVISPPVVLNHSSPTENKGRDVTTLDWNDSGSFLATGSYDGIVRIWNEKGEAKNVLSKHKGPVFSLKWNKSGNYLVSGSYDGTAIIWDVQSGSVKQVYELHSASVLDVDWKDDTTFASCSSDKNIFVCKLGESKPLKSFSGHSDEVNAIKWSPSGQYLASCSDDHTAMVWSVKQDNPIQTFSEHSKEIYSIKWSPTGPGTQHPNSNLYLATASFDTLIKLWDIESSKSVLTLSKHTEPVYAISFSPDGKYLASGSLDQNVYIWSVKDGSLIKTYKGDGSIFEVSWNKTGDKFAACFSTNKVCVMDFRM